VEIYKFKTMQHWQSEASLGSWIALRTLISGLAHWRFEFVSDFVSAPTGCGATVFGYAG
jgi:hypothetical protein